jgi:hypothetical protein
LNSSYFLKTTIVHGDANANKPHPGRFPMKETGEVRPEDQPGPRDAREGAPVALDDPRVVRAVEDFMAALEAGQRPARPEFLAGYPEIADALSECLAGLEFVREMAPELSQPGWDGLVEGDGPDAKPLGDFRILREIGRGGMGVVFEAEQMSLGRRVALKMLPFAATMDPRHLQRSKNEARAAASLEHPHIVPVYGVGCERGVHYYAMKLIDGQSLASLIAHQRAHSARGGRQPPVGAQEQGVDAPRAPESATAPVAAARTERAPRDAAAFRQIAA